MKNVYLLECRNLNSYTDRYELYDTEIFSTLKRVLTRMNQAIVINEGYAIDINNRDEYNICLDYSCKAVDFENKGRIIKCRFVVRKMPVNKIDIVDKELNSIYDLI